MADLADDEDHYLRTDDDIFLQCVAKQGSEKYCLAAEGFASKLCRVEPMIDSQDTPTNSSSCVFILYQALSLRALHELLSSLENLNQRPSQTNRSLLYGNAIQLKHRPSGKLLACLKSSSRASDKLSLDVGLSHQETGEDCWWTVHPASKQRSVGEKVRAGDRLLLISVSSERYLHFFGELHSVQASFQQTAWNVGPVSSQAGQTQGYLKGNDCFHLCHSHVNDFMTTARTENHNQCNQVYFKTGLKENQQTPTIWRLELMGVKWSGSHVRWGQPFRLYHVMSGHYLCLSEDRGLALASTRDATKTSSVFCWQPSKDKTESTKFNDTEDMGEPDVKFGECICFLQHVETGLWVTYQAVTAKTARGDKARRAIAHHEGHMDDGLSLSCAQPHVSSTASIILKTERIFYEFLNDLTWLERRGHDSNTMVMNFYEFEQCVHDLLSFFHEPKLEDSTEQDEDDRYEDQQVLLQDLKDRQNFFEEEGCISLILQSIEKLSLAIGSHDLTTLSVSNQSWKRLLDYLYSLLAATLKNNSSSCARLASKLDWLVSQLDGQQASESTLDVLVAVIAGSNEAVNMVKEKHIQTIVSFLKRHGRNSKVIGILSSLCVCNGLAVRSNQELICDNLLHGRDMLLQTAEIPHVTSVCPNIYVGIRDGCATNCKWYYEVMVERCSVTSSNTPPLLRVGWANTRGFSPYPTGGNFYGQNAIGDDAFSFSYDGVSLWNDHQGCPVSRSGESCYFRPGEVISCCLNLGQPSISFRVDGLPVQGIFEDFNTNGLFFPVVSFSAGVKIRFLLGDNSNGQFRFFPPEGYLPYIEAKLPDQILTVLPCEIYGRSPADPDHLIGPTFVQENDVIFVPQLFDTHKIALTQELKVVGAKLAQANHDLWAVDRIQDGWKYGPNRDHAKKLNPCLVEFSLLPDPERNFNLAKSLETIRTVVALGYNIALYDKNAEQRLKKLKFSQRFMMSNGYKPAPYDLNDVILSKPLEDLVDQLAANGHHMWARERISQGWTYNLHLDVVKKRTPRLIPFHLLDRSVKQLNRHTTREWLRTLIALGYAVQAPVIQTSQNTDNSKKNSNVSRGKMRIFRAEKNRAVTSGKWYFETLIKTEGEIRVGWALPETSSCVDLGVDETAYVFDGYNASLWHNGPRNFGQTWRVGDVISCLLDLNEQFISFALNGELFMDRSGQEKAFADLPEDTGFVPIISLSEDQEVIFNLGQRPETLKYHSTIGVQQGYKPFAAGLQFPVPMWLTKNMARFRTIEECHESLKVVKIHSTDGKPPNFQISLKTDVSRERSTLQWVFTRINMPIMIEPMSTKPIKPFTSTTTRYSFSVRVFPRQDPANVYVGWVTSNFKWSHEDFRLDDVPITTIAVGDDSGRIFERVKRSNCFMVSFGDVIEHLNTSSNSGTAATDWVIFTMDTANGQVTLNSGGNVFQTSCQALGCAGSTPETSIRLYPAVFALPTSTKIFEYEIGAAQLGKKGSATMSQPQTIPLLLFIQSLTPVAWSRMRDHAAKTECRRDFSRAGGWLSELPSSGEQDHNDSAVVLHLPEDNFSIDLKEISEFPDLLEFHLKTLMLYSSMCALGNHSVAHKLCRYIDQCQIMHILCDLRLVGELRTSFADLLIEMHLASHARALKNIDDVYVFPFNDKTKSVKLFEDPKNKISFLPGTKSISSLKPRMRWTPVKDLTSSPMDPVHLNVPEFPLVKLRKLVVCQLEEAVVSIHRQYVDANPNMQLYVLVPALRIAINLLRMGLFEKEETCRILLLLDTEYFKSRIGGRLTTVKNYDMHLKALGAGLLHMQLEEPVKLETCRLLHLFIDLILQHRVEATISFTSQFVDYVQKNQRNRYRGVMDALDMSAAVTAKVTKEFRSTSNEQMRMLLKFKTEVEDENCPLPNDLREVLWNFHLDLLFECGIQLDLEDEDSSKKVTSYAKLSAFVSALSGKVAQKKEVEGPNSSINTNNVSELIVDTMIRWTKQGEIEDSDLIREIFHLLHRQYSSIQELHRVLTKTYCVSSISEEDTMQLLDALTSVHSLLSVKLGIKEEGMIITQLNNILNLKVFYQHPNLMRMLSVHEIVMQIMVNALGSNKDTGRKTTQFPRIVSACCRFLCYFCRISRLNQIAMFEHIEFFLDHSNVGLASPSMRGLTPLDVAAASLLENNELVLSLKESDIEKLVEKLSVCGLESCPTLLEKGYTDLGWNPLEGERYLDFLKNAVFVNEESVEENASIVLRQLIRRPESLGPGLRGEGSQGLLAVITEALDIADDPLRDTGLKEGLLGQVKEEDEKDEDLVHVGFSIFSFYSALIGLLGKCAPEQSLILQGKSEPLRIRSILRSLVSYDDLIGVMSLPFKLPIVTDTSVEDLDLAACFNPDHKSSMILFLERVYGFETDSLLLELLAKSLLPDMRMVVQLDTPDLNTTDVALALNRYMFHSVFPFLIRHVELLSIAQHNNKTTIDSLVQTIFRMSRARALTKAQQDMTSDCLIAVCSVMKPAYLQNLLRELTVEVMHLRDESLIPLRVLTNHYNRCWKYYYFYNNSTVHDLETSSLEEKRLSFTLFWTVFDAASRKEYDENLFEIVLKCLITIANSLPPDLINLSSSTENLDLKESAGKRRFSNMIIDRVAESIQKASDYVNALTLALEKARNAKKRKLVKTDSLSDGSTSVDDLHDVYQVKFFSKIILPFMESYYKMQDVYYVEGFRESSDISTCGSQNEKEKIALMFCKLSTLLRQRTTLFGVDADCAINCLGVLAGCFDQDTITPSSPEMLKKHLFIFFNNAAEDLETMLSQIERAVNPRRSLAQRTNVGNYVIKCLLPTLTKLFQHVGRHHFGRSFFVKEIHFICIKIFKGLYKLGILKKETYIERHRAEIGECLAAFSSSFPLPFLESKLTFGHDASYSLPVSAETPHIDASAIPSLRKMLTDVTTVSSSGIKYEKAPEAYDVVMPVICRYASLWYGYDPAKEYSENYRVTSSVSQQTLQRVITDLLKLLQEGFNSDSGGWMRNVAENTLPIMVGSGNELLKTGFLPIMKKVSDLVQKSRVIEEQLKNGNKLQNDAMELELTMLDDYSLLVTDIYAVFPLLLRYIDISRSRWIKTKSANAIDLFVLVSEIFVNWSRSMNFQREERSYVVKNYIDNMAIIKSDTEPRPDAESVLTDRRTVKRRGDIYSASSSLIVTCAKRMLPVALDARSYDGETHVNDTNCKNHELLDAAVKKLCARETDDDIREFISNQLLIIGANVIVPPGKDPTEWFLLLSKVQYHLYVVHHPSKSKINVWKKLMTKQRRLAVVSCFRMVPLYNLPIHQVITVFADTYAEYWLLSEKTDFSSLLLAATQENNREDIGEGFNNELDCLETDPLRQLIQVFNRSAVCSNGKIMDDHLYMSYTDLMAESCHTGDDDEDEVDDDEEDAEDEDVDEEEEKSFEEQEKEKQRLLYEQKRLAIRGAAEMVLSILSASSGEISDTTRKTLRLGIALLTGGNQLVQKIMLEHLQTRKDEKFFKSLAELMCKCSVLDLNAYERQVKAELLGSFLKGGSNEISSALNDDQLARSLFRFLQLLCEGHNTSFQNYLRTQPGNNTSVNLVVATVDYLLRLQESISDFYWYYSGRDHIDASGQKNFELAIQVASQVFNSITEYIQGPCEENQQALSRSRLWDAVIGFLHVFANMQLKLSSARQLDLLKNLLDLLQDMVVMLLSMLEGNVVDGIIGHQLVDTLIESSQNVSLILAYFNIFLRLKDITSSERFRQYDLNDSGFVNRRDFQRALEASKVYTSEEIEFLIKCAVNPDEETLDYVEFVERFHEPAADIGFNLAVLLTNLSEHMPKDYRLKKFLVMAEAMLDYFKPNLGRIEILGEAKRIERVYFEIKHSSLEQWKKPQVQESKRQFFFDVINQDGEKGRMEEFVNFCEDTIFEMQLAAELSSEDQSEKIARKSQEQENKNDESKFYISSIYNKAKIQYRKFRGMSYFEIFLALLWLSFSLQINIIELIFKFIKSFGSLFWSVIFAEAMKPKKCSDALEDKGFQTKEINSDHSYYDDGESAVDDSTSNEPSTDDHTLVLDAFGIEISNNGLKLLDANDKERSQINRGFGDLSVEDITGTEANPQPVTAKKPPKSKPPAKSKAAQSLISNLLPSSFNLQTIRIHGRPKCYQKEEKIENRTAMYLEKLKAFHLLIVGMFARNFYNFQVMALVVTFLINFVLLFFKVLNDDIKTNDVDKEFESDENDVIVLDVTWRYMEMLLVSLSILHALLSFSMLVAYYYLKVPLMIFKREKEIARKLEFDGLYVDNDPSDDDLSGQWDRLVISCPSFPSKYWDKFVKKKVMDKYEEQCGSERLRQILGMQNSSNSYIFEEETTTDSLIAQIRENIDTKYGLWKVGVMFSNRSFLYLACYFLMSVLGQYNRFFFSLHLLDIAVSSKALRTILKSVTHNGKQLCLTIGLLTIVVYLYTVIAFNFFRQFYNKSEEGAEPEWKCHDMFTCFQFHLYAGVRAGGGIGDELEDPSGDDHEFFRIIFDISFFFFVVVILLAIIQGLIIDAFGELRDQQEQVREDMETKCFICTIGNDYFDQTPHGFETHTEEEHNLANYMFFLMYLINKDETEFTGQETYVWRQYQERCWEFFPAGDCFRKQYENELA